MNHKEMTAHIRNRLSAAGIKARCKMQEYCGSQVIAIDVPKFGVEFTATEQTAMVNIVNANRLTFVRGLPVVNDGTMTFGGKFYM